MVKEIKLNNGMVALIDDEDYELVSKYKWYADKGRTTWYARAYIPGSGRKNKNHIRLHQLIMSPKSGEEVDHINHNGLSCLRSNMRMVTTAQNTRNRIKINKGNTTSRFKGVYWRDDIKKWRVKIHYNYKCIHIDYFKNEEDAAHAYDVAAKKYHGEYACLNFPAAEQ